MSVIEGDGRTQMTDETAVIEQVLLVHRAIEVLSSIVGDDGEAFFCLCLICAYLSSRQSRCIVSQHHATSLTGQCIEFLIAEAIRSGFFNDITHTEGRAVVCWASAI